jgi:pilus assembly protein CpaB
MKMKSMVLFGVAITLGLFAMLGVQKVMSQNNNKAEYVQVLVALTDIAPGVPLDETNVTFRRWPLDAVPEGAVTKEEQYVERALRGATVAGEVIMAAKLGEKGVFGASSEIPEGMRAVTVSVDPTKTHSGQIQPGDRVDVLVTYKSRTSRGMVTRTKSVLEFIKVFSVDSRRANVGETQEVSAKNISLLVTPDQANLLMLAEDKGTLHLALRHKTDSVAAKAATIDDSIFDEAETQVGKGDPRDPEFDPESRRVEDAESIAQALQRELSGGSPAGASATTPAGSSGTQVPAPEAPLTWKIQIFSGEQVRIEEVELPEEKQETEEEPAKVSGLWKTIQGVVSKKSL